MESGIGNVLYQIVALELKCNRDKTKKETEVVSEFAMPSSHTHAANPKDISSHRAKQKGKSLAVVA